MRSIFLHSSLDDVYGGNGKRQNETCQKKQKILQRLKHNQAFKVLSTEHESSQTTNKPRGATREQGGKEKKHISAKPEAGLQGYMLYLIPSEPSEGPRLEEFC